MRFVAAMRVWNAAFFFAVAAFCFLSYSPFAYSQFIKPAVIPALNGFVALSPVLYWIASLATLLTLVPVLRRGERSMLAWGYVVAAALAGLAVWRYRPLATIENSFRGFVVGCVALVFPVWLAAVDCVTTPSRAIRAVDPARVLRVCVAAAALAWAVYAVAAPVRLRSAVGIDLGTGDLLIAGVASLTGTAFVFVAIFLALMIGMALARFGAAPGKVEHRWFIALGGTIVAAVLYFLVCAALAFQGPAAVVACSAAGVAFAVWWAGLTRLRLSAGAADVDSLTALTAPIAGSPSRAAAVAALAAAPFVAYVVQSSAAQLDWNFLFQKIAVLIVWTAVFAAVVTLVRARPARSRQLALIAVPLIVLPADAAVARLAPQLVLDRYAAIDPSFRLLRDARAGRSSETAEYYAFLRANTLVSPKRVQPIDADFVRPLTPAGQPLPDVYLLVVDSLRRDYVAPFNPKVTFTPEIARFAAESYAFDRAFTRYSGTFMAVRSLWSGGMIMHVLQQPSFERRDTLLKLLDANGYLKLMDVDSVVNDFVPGGPDVVALGHGRGTMDFDVCSTVDELSGRLAAMSREQPVFFWALPQDVHISAFVNMSVPHGEAYPGFYDKAAYKMRRADACFGRFVDFLKRSGRYDNSIVILAADHGDSYGEEGRWGHGNFLYPETMRVPLIVHLPPRLAGRMTTDLDQVAFITDISPTLYALLGYEPADLGLLYGRPLFTARDAPTPPERRDDFLVASSYGAVYGLVREDGRRMYVVDAIEGRDTAFDMTRGSTPLALTPTMTANARRTIRGQIDRLAAMYSFAPEP